MNCNNNQNNNNGCGCNCNPHPTPAPEPVDINMSVCDRNINMLPMLQTYTTKVLKPNINGCCKKNILKQCMMNCENYKYVIKWDFDLDGKTITVPENCILEFDGGSLKNGTIIGQDTMYINVGDVDIWGESLIRQGTWREGSGGGIPDKDYDPEDFSGLGRKTLKLKDGSNILVQDDFYKDGEGGQRVPSTNTLFSIQYDFTLGDITERPINFSSENVSSVESPLYKYETVKLEYLTDEKDKLVREEEALETKKTELETEKATLLIKKQQLIDGGASQTEIDAVQAEIDAVQTELDSCVANIAEWQAKIALYLTRIADQQTVVYNTSQYCLYQRVELGINKALLANNTGCVFLNQALTEIISNDIALGNEYSGENVIVYVGATTPGVHILEEKNYVRIPDNCILSFDGGSIKNGTIVGNNTKVSANEVNVFNNIDIRGTWNIDCAYSDWFSFDNTGESDSSHVIKSLIALSDTIKFNGGIYSLGTVDINKSLKIIGSNNTVFAAQPMEGTGGRVHKEMFSFKNADRISFENVTFKGCGYYNDAMGYPLPLSGSLLAVDTASDVLIDNCKFIDAFSGLIGYHDKGLVAGFIDCDNVSIINSYLSQTAGAEIICATHVNKRRDDCNFKFNNNYCTRLFNNGTNGYTILTAVCGRVEVCDNTIYAYRYAGSAFNVFGNYTYCNHNNIDITIDPTRPEPPVRAIDLIFDNTEAGLYSGEYFECIGNTVIAPNAKFVTCRAKSSVVRDNVCSCFCGYIHFEASDLDPREEGQTSDVDSVLIDNNVFDLTNVNDIYTGNPNTRLYADGIAVLSLASVCKKVTITNNVITIDQVRAMKFRRFIRLVGVQEVNVCNNTIYSNMLLRNSTLYRTYLTIGRTANTPDMAVSFSNNKLYARDGSVVRYFSVIEKEPFRHTTDLPLVINNLIVNDITGENPVTAVFSVDNCLVWNAHVSGLNIMVDAPVIYNIEYDKVLPAASFVTANDKNVISFMDDANGYVIGRSTTVGRTIDITGLRFKNINEPTFIKAGTIVRYSTADGFPGYDERAVIPLSDVTIDLTEHPLSELPRSGGMEVVGPWNGVYWVFVNTSITRYRRTALSLEGRCTIAARDEMTQNIKVWQDFVGSSLFMTDNDVKKPCWWDDVSWKDALGNDLSTEYIPIISGVTAGNVPMFTADGTLEDSDKAAANIPSE